jgi:hypothetical protein
MEYQHMSALDASQDREGHEIDSGGRSESDDEFDQDSVAIGNLAAAVPAKLADQLPPAGLMPQWKLPSEGSPGIRSCRRWIRWRPIRTALS